MFDDLTNWNFWNAAIFAEILDFVALVNEGLELKKTFDSMQAHWI